MAGVTTEREKQVNFTPSSSSHSANRLSGETSPYLLQHAHNPVDWYPWGPEAFAAAQNQDKPIFLSVGYSTCYWCHVMERQSFENPEIAAEMNRLFINIKVDREERPDVDQLYMTAVQYLTSRGGWPMSVFLTPDLRPFYGGTYFPPHDSRGRAGFMTLMRKIDEVYRIQPLDIQNNATRIVEVLQQYAEPPLPQDPVRIDDAFVETQIRKSVADYDPRFGGFGGAPKFPRQTLLELLLAFLHSPVKAGNFKSRVEQMLLFTLDALADGGIRDQIGGAFHRYATDEKWLVPHFEIMLYDNAMLAWCYVEAFVLTGESRYAGVARGIFDFVLREMTSPDGGFYTAFDAEVDAQEGLSYLWTVPQIEAALGLQDARFFNKVYGVDRGPNFADPHQGSGIPEKNILFWPRPPLDVAASLNLTPQQLEERLIPMRKKLLESRHRRKQPLLDTKIITSWNALMVRAMARGGQVFSESRYLDAATIAMRHLLTAHRAPGGGLYRCSRDGTAKYRGFLDDYAFVCQALLALANATGESTWRDQAVEMADSMQARFGDREMGGFYFNEKDAADLIVRQKIAADSPLPSGNAVAARVLLELGRLAEAQQTIAVFAQAMESQGPGASAMVLGALEYLQIAAPFTVAPAAAPTAAQRSDPFNGVVAVITEWRTPIELCLHLSIEPGYHLNAHDLPAGSPFRPTSLWIDEPGVKVDYPPSEYLTAQFADVPLRVYTGDVTLCVRFPYAWPIDKPITLALNYQACNESECLPEVTREVRAVRTQAKE